MLTKKNLIIIHSNGTGACALLRGGALATLSRSRMTGDLQFIESPEIINDEYILKHTVAVVINRFWREDQIAMVRHYDKYRRRQGFGLKVFLEYDDLMWDLDGKQCIPVFNPAPISSVEAGKNIDKVLGLVDGTFVTCPWLMGCWKYRFNDNVVIIPNFIPKHLYGFNPRKVKKDIKKPVVLYGGSPYHFKKDMEGDFAGPWIPWIKEAVNGGKIEMHMFGTCGWMFEDIKDKIVFHPPTPSILWPQVIRDIHPDIYIAPLVDHPFNRAKSDLKYTEASAIGAAFLGSYWEQFCPYEDMHELSRVTIDMTAEQLQVKVDEICKKDNFNAIMEHQQKHAESMWLENFPNTVYYLKQICQENLQVVTRPCNT